MLLSISRNKDICAKYVGIATDRWIYVKCIYNHLANWPIYFKIRRIDTYKTGETLFYKDNDGITHEVHPHIFNSEHDQPIFSKRFVKLDENNPNDLKIIKDIETVVEQGFKSDRNLRS